MKKLFLTLLFNICFSISGFAQTIANANYDNNMVGGVRNISKCWECKLVEGVYTYSFNFVFKMYKVIAPVIASLVLVFLAFWFLWYVWENVIKAHMNFKGGNVFDFLKEIWKKLFTVLFVLSLLWHVPANRIFSYTIDPIMSFGAGFGKWILIETRNENEIMQDYSKAVLNKKLPKFDCSNITLSKNTLDMFRVNGVDGESEMNVDTLKNLICITGEYSNSYTIGLNLGAKILSRGLIGFAENLGAESIRKKIDSFSSFIPQVGWGKIAYFALKIILILAKIWLVAGLFTNMLIVVIGGFIMIQFLYVGLTFITMILDIVIQLALVGVMMPIVIGSWAYPDKGMGNLRGKLSGKLFWGVLRCSFRLGFLAVSMSITIFLLNELMTTKFTVGSDDTMLSLYEVLNGNKGLLTQGFILNNSTYDFVKLLISNVGLLIAMIFTTLVSWMLLRESIKKADSFSGALYSGVSNDNILNGLKKLTTSSIEYVMSGAKREVDFYKKNKLAKKILDEDKQEAKDVARKSQIEKWENEVFNEGNTEHLFDIPAEKVVDEYDKIRNIEQPPKDDSLVPTVPTKDETETSVKFENAPMELNIKENIEEVKKEQSKESEFISTELASPEFKDLPEDKKEKLTTSILSEDKESLIDISKDTEIAKMFEIRNATPKEDDEIVNDKFVTDNLIATEVVSADDLSNPVIKLQSTYIRQQIIEEIKNLPQNEQKEIKKFMKLTKKPNLSKKEKREEFEKQKRIYEKLESKVKADMRAKQQKIKDLMLEREKLKSTNKKKSVLTAKNVIQTIKNDELNNLKAELEELNFSDIAQRSLLRREMKKLEEEITAISEKDNLELEDEYDAIVANWKRKKRRRKARINPLKKI